MGYVTLYRKWRPQTFEAVVGQEHIVRTLTNALTDNRVAHAYIFSGPRGTGKTSIAKILAKALNCVDGPTPLPCNKCASCLEITAGTGLDVIEIDAASNRGIDEIRDIRDKVKFMPAGGGTKVYIIDEVHMLTPEAFNALLKMLEEPPSHVVFILATTEPHKVLQTILSRCQRFDFRRLKADELAGRLREIAKAEGIDVDEASVALIAKQARGGMRDAVSTLDQLSSYTGSVIRSEDVMAMLGMVDTGLLFRITDSICGRDAASSLMFVNEIVEAGWDLRQFCRDLTEHFRNLFVIKNTAKPADAVNATTEELARLKEQADGFSLVELTDAIEILSALNSEMRFATDPRLLLELALVKMTIKTGSREQGVESSKNEPKIKESREPRAASHEEEQEKGNPVGVVLQVDTSRSKEQLTPGDFAIARNHKYSSSERSELRSSGDEATSNKGNEIDMVKRAWPAVSDAVKKKKMSVFANLLECRLIGVEGTMVVLEFNKKAAVHKGRIESEANKSFIEEILREITGKPYVIKCVMGTESREPEAASREEESKTKESREGAPLSLEGRGQGEGGARKTKNDSAEVAASPVDQAPRNDVSYNDVPRNDVQREEVASAPESDEGKLTLVTGMFPDSKVVETKVRKDET